MRSATSISTPAYAGAGIAELCYEGGKGFLYVAVDRTSKLVFARIYRRATKLAAAAFLRAFPIEVEALCAKCLKRKR
jgi:hypothetical protein